MKLLALKIAICACLIGAALFLCLAVYNCQRMEVYKEQKLKKSNRNESTKEINSESYGTDTREEYVMMFYDGLVGEENWHRYLGGGLFFCFNHGKFIKQFKKFDNALEFMKGL